MDRRFFKRFNLEGCTGVLFLPEEEVPVNVKDISRGGILFETNSYGFCIDNVFKFQFVDKMYNIVSGNASLVRVKKEENGIIIGCRCNEFDPRGYIERIEMDDAMKAYA